jgi:hypothetical protein
MDTVRAQPEAGTLDAAGATEVRLIVDSGRPASVQVGLVAHVDELAQPVQHRPTARAGEWTARERM